MREIGQSPSTTETPPEGGQPFEFYVPMVAFEKSSAPEGKQRRVAGIISTETKDLQGETILQDGLDFSYFKSNGWLNNNHKDGMTDILGYPDKVLSFAKGERLPDGTIAKGPLTWQEGYLLHTKQADDVWELARALAKTDRRLGFSVEGQILQRQDDDRKIITKAQIRNVALTHCFPGDTQVIGSARSITRRWYDGPMIEVVLANGQKLTGTPNHPVLTSRGWQKLGSLNEASDSVGYRLAYDRAAPGVQVNVDNVPPTMEQLFNTLRDARAKHDVRAGVEGDFHGDGAAGQVDVVLIEGELRHRMHAKFAQHFGEGALPAADARQSLLTGHREFAGVLPRHILAASRLVRRFDTRLARLIAQSGRAAQLLLAPTPAYAFALGLVEHGFSADAETLRNARGSFARNVSGYDGIGDSWVQGRSGAQDASLAGPIGDALTRDAITGTDCGRALSESIGFQHIRHVRRIERFSGHVYNLETEHGWYEADGITAHNCPVNPDSRLDILMRSLQAKQGGVCDKALSMGDATPVQSGQSYSGEGAGKVLAIESIDGMPRQKRLKKKNRKLDKAMSADEAVAWCQRSVPGMDEKTAQQIVQITRAFVRSDLIGT